MHFVAVHIYQCEHINILKTCVKQIYLANETECPRGTNPGRTHRFYTGEPVVPFGFGLSYTTFAYALASAPAEPVISLAPAQQLLDATLAAGRTFPSSHLVNEAAPLASYLVNVTNTGTIDADDVVLGFLRPPGAGIDGVPLQTLFGFERVHVKAGPTVSVYLYPRHTNTSRCLPQPEKVIKKNQELKWPSTCTKFTP